MSGDIAASIVKSLSVHAEGQTAHELWQGGIQKPNVEYSDFYAFLLDEVNTAAPKWMFHKVKKVWYLNESKTKTKTSTRDNHVYASLLACATALNAVHTAAFPVPPADVDVNIPYSEWRADRRETMKVLRETIQTLARKL